MPDIPMFTFNCRVLEFANGERSIHNVYYNESGAPMSYGEKPLCVAWNKNGRGADLVPHQQLAHMMRALTLPVLVVAETFDD